MYDISLIIRFLAMQNPMKKVIILKLKKVIVLRAVGIAVAIVNLSFGNLPKNPLYQPEM